MAAKWWAFLHLFFAFSFVGTLVLADWNGRSARAAKDWSHRALLFGIVHLATRTIGAGSLILLGVFGNLLSVSLGYRMAGNLWMWAVNGLWLLAVAVSLAWLVPSCGALERIARHGAEGAGAGQTPGDFALEYERALARWRTANLIMSLLYLALLALMVFRQP